jgi:tetratricopeptide (TPR) repeat protein
MGELSRAQATLTNKAAREEYDAGLALAERGVPTDIRQIFGADEAFRAGRRLLDRGAFAEADEQFKAAVTANPSEPEYWAYRYWTEYTLASADGQAPRATSDRILRALRQLGEKHEKCAAAWLHAGHIERNNGDIAAATAAYRRVIELDRDNLEAASALRLLSRREDKKSSSGFFGRLFKR